MNCDSFWWSSSAPSLAALKLTHLLRGGQVARRAALLLAFRPFASSPQVRGKCPPDTIKIPNRPRRRKHYFSRTIKITAKTTPTISTAASSVKTISRPRP